MADVTGVIKRTAGGKTTVSSMKGVKFHGKGHERSETPEFGIALHDLDHDQCRYPLTSDRPHGFCGAPKLPRKSYCNDHQILTRDPLPFDESGDTDGVGGGPY
jgi:hypothetical protein